MGRILAFIIQELNRGPNRIHSVSGHTMYKGSNLRSLSDGELLARLDALAAQERESTADVVEHLLELDRRELAIDRAYPSIFVYCVKKLGYSEAAAFSRIRAARAAANFPDVLSRLRSGTLHLDSIARLSKHLDEDNSQELLDRASGASKREVLALVAQFQTEPGAQRDVIIPVPAGASEAPQPLGDPNVGRVNQSEAEIVPPMLHRFHFTADAEFLEMVDRLRALLRHKIPDGRLENIFKEAVKALLSSIERDRSAPAGPSRRPGPSVSAHTRRGSRVVPRTIKRVVWTRDSGRCAYTAPDGHRCESRDALEYDHIIAWADGGRSDTAENIRLLCRAHNQRLGRRRFGARGRR